MIPTVTRFGAHDPRLTVGDHERASRRNRRRQMESRFSASLDARPMPSSHFSSFLAATRDLPREMRGLGENAIINPPSLDFGYVDTPSNAVTFAHTGVDGVHYALLARDGDVSNDSPVVQVSPMDFGEPVVVVARSFLEFLAIGCDLPEPTVETLLAGAIDDGRQLIAVLGDRFQDSRLFRDKRRLDALCREWISDVVPRPGGS
jgi:hypothetical protein